MKPPEQISLTPEALEALCERIAACSLSDEDKNIILGVMGLPAWLQYSLVEKKISLNRLKKFLGFVGKSEKRSKKKTPPPDTDNGSDDDSDNDKLPANDDDSGNSPEGSKPGSQSSDDDGNKKGNQKDGDQNKSDNKPKPPGHGRNSYKTYKNAERIFVPHELYKVGDTHECCGGRLYEFRRAPVPKFQGSPITFVTVYMLQVLRCAKCQETFTAKMPNGLTREKYDSKCRAILCFYRFYGGMPYYRNEAIQEILGYSFPDSTQWDVIESTHGRCIPPVFDEMKYELANSDLLLGDDTGVKILSAMKENKHLSENDRKGMFTTGIVGKKDEKTIVMFVSGRNYMGESASELLNQREEASGKAILMTDASPMNNLNDDLSERIKTQILHAYCMSHNRRKYYDLEEFFPKEVAFILDKIGLVYANDKYCKENNLSPKERLVYHQEHSKPAMDELEVFLKEHMEQKKVEPNSHLGKAMLYTLKHWERLTLFLREEGAPLDTNLVEGVLKIAIRIRKNSYFFKTTKSARISNELLSVIYTALINGYNPVDYLIALQENQVHVHESPKKWLPWTYEATLQELNQKKKGAA